MSQTVGEQATSVSAPAVKMLSSTGIAAATWGINTWSDVAAILAALYSVCLLLEWAWRKAVRPFCETRGWIVRRQRRKEDFVSE